MWGFKVLRELVEMRDGRTLDVCTAWRRGAGAVLQRASFTVSISTRFTIRRQVQTSWRNLGATLTPRAESRRERLDRMLCIAREALARSAAVLGAPSRTLALVDMRFHDHKSMVQYDRALFSRSGVSGTRV